MTTCITAHRGCSQLAPENSWPAIELAIQMGVDSVEIDIQETQDHELVVIHDSHLYRLAGVDAHVWELTALEISRLNIGQGFSQDFVGTGIPTLASVMSRFQARVTLNLELKSHGHEQDLVPQVVSLIRQGHWQSACVVSSMSWDLLRRMQALAPDIRVGPVITPSHPQLPDFEVDFYSIHFTLATPEFLDNAHTVGKSVHVWTVNQTSDMERVLALGVDNIITDQPMRLRALLTQSQASGASLDEG